MWGLPAYFVYCDMGKHPDLAKSTLYGHYVRALDVLFSYWPCLYGKQPMAARYNPHCPVVSVVKLAYEDTVGAKAIARSWAESPCTCAKFNEIPETDRPTDTHNRLEMRYKISCLA